MHANKHVCILIIIPIVLVVLMCDEQFCWGKVSITQRAQLAAAYSCLQSAFQLLGHGGVWSYWLHLERVKRLSHRALLFPGDVQTVLDRKIGALTLVVVDI